MEYFELQPLGTQKPVLAESISRVALGDLTAHPASWTRKDFYSASSMDWQSLPGLPDRRLLRLSCFFARRSGPGCPGCRDRSYPSFPPPETLWSAPFRLARVWAAPSAEPCDSWSWRWSIAEGFFAPPLPPRVGIACGFLFPFCFPFSPLPHAPVDTSIARGFESSLTRFIPGFPPGTAWFYTRCH